MEDLLIHEEVIMSDRAIQVNIRIIRVFTKMRFILESHKEILMKLDELQKKDLEQDPQIILIFDYLRQMDMDTARWNGGLIEFFFIIATGKLLHDLI